MDNKKLSVILKSVIAFLAVLGAVVFGVILPALLSAFAARFPAYERFFLPWLVFLLIAAVPLYLILGFGVAVAGEMGRDNSFCRRNVNCLKGVALCLLAEAVYFFAGNVVLWLLHCSAPLIVWLALGLSLFAAAIALAVFVLANLLQKAVVLREENEAFI